MQKKLNTYRITVQRDHVRTGTTEFIMIMPGTTPGNAEMQVIFLFEDTDTWLDTRIMKTVKLEGVEQQLLFQI